MGTTIRGRMIISILLWMLASRQNRRAVPMPPLIIRARASFLAVSLAQRPVLVRQRGVGEPGPRGRVRHEPDRAVHRVEPDRVVEEQELSLIHISEPTRLLSTSYAVFC